MGFRDDRAAARLRAAALEQDLHAAKRELEAKDRQLEAMRDELEATKRRDFPASREPPSAPPSDPRPLGLVTIGVVVAGLGATALTLLEWSSQLERMTSEMITAGRGTWVGLANLSNQIYMGVYTALTLLLAGVGVGQLLRARWHAKVAVVWGGLGVLLVLADVVAMGTLRGRFAADAPFTIIYPIVMIVTGMRAQRSRA